MTNTEIHPFEKAGLGKAPFRFVGMAQQDRIYGEVILNRAEYEKTGIALTTKPGGTCAYCGTYILNMYNIKSADGKCFHVGCDCVEKTGDAKLIKVVTDARRKADKERRAAKAADVSQRVNRELSELLGNDGVRNMLERLPHPNAYMATRGATLLGWCEFQQQRGGVFGKSKAVKIINSNR